MPSQRVSSRLFLTNCAPEWFANTAIKPTHFQRKYSGVNEVLSREFRAVLLSGSLHRTYAVVFLLSRYGNRDGASQNEFKGLRVELIRGPLLHSNLLTMVFCTDRLAIVFILLLVPLYFHDRRHFIK